MTWDLLDEDCADISDWVDDDAINGVSEVSPAGQFRMDANTAASTNKASRSRAISTATTMTVEIKLYHDGIGTEANTDNFLLNVGRDAGGTDVFIRAVFASDGLFIHDGTSSNEVGTNLVSVGTWQTWRILLDFTTPASATCDVYLDDVLEAKDVDCSYTTTGLSDGVSITQLGWTTANRLTHIDWIKIKTGLDAPGDDVLFFGCNF